MKIIDSPATVTILRIGVRLPVISLIAEDDRDSLTLSFRKGENSLNEAKPK